MQAKTGIARLVLLSPDTPVVPIGQWGPHRTGGFRIKRFGRRRTSFASVGQPLDMSRFRGKEPSALIVILFSIAGALAALALQRYVIIGATAFGGAWTIIVGALALSGTRVAVAAAARNNVWLAYPMNPAPGQYWVLFVWLALGVAGVFVQLAVTAKGKK